MAQWLACWAHNPKVRGSKPRSAKVFGAPTSATTWCWPEHPWSLRLRWTQRLACRAHNPKVRGIETTLRYGVLGLTLTTTWRRARHAGACACDAASALRLATVPSLSLTSAKTWRRPRGPGACTCDAANTLRLATVPRGQSLKDGAQWHQQRSGAAVSVLGS